MVDTAKATSSNTKDPIPKPRRTVFALIGFAQKTLTRMTTFSTFVHKKPPIANSRSEIKLIITLHLL